MTQDPQPRLPPLSTAEWVDQQRALLRGNLARADRYLSAEPDAPPIPPILGLFARHPHIGGAWLAFSGALIENGSLPERDRELLILRVGHRTNSGYLLSQHRPMAEKAGLGNDKLEALHDEPSAFQWSDRDLHLIRAADELIDGYTVTDGTWVALTASFNEQQLLEVLFLVGSYVCLSMVLNSVELPS